MQPLKIVTHSRTVLDIAERHGWLPGARYTNLRDIRHRPRIGLIDIQWGSYDFAAHLQAVKKTHPILTVAQDILRIADLDRILQQAEALAAHCETVIIVPKDPRLRDVLDREIPKRFRLGFSVPTRYGASRIEPRYFRRPVHLLGGRPDVQRKLAEQMQVVSFDCNRFTLDAAFGDYFDGETFRPHPQGGYKRCIEDSLLRINSLWHDYKCMPGITGSRTDSGRVHRGSRKRSDCGSLAKAAC